MDSREQPSNNELQDTPGSNPIDELLLRLKEQYPKPMQQALLDAFRVCDEISYAGTNTVPGSRNNELFTSESLEQARAKWEEMMQKPPESIRDAYGVIEVTLMPEPAEAFSILLRAASARLSLQAAQAERERLEMEKTSRLYRFEKKLFGERAAEDDLIKELNTKRLPVFERQTANEIEPLAGTLDGPIKPADFTSPGLRAAALFAKYDIDISARTSIKDAVRQYHSPRPI